MMPTMTNDKKADLIKQPQACLSRILLLWCNEEHDPQLQQMGHLPAALPVAAEFSADMKLMLYLGLLGFGMASVCHSGCRQKMGRRGGCESHEFYVAVSCCRRTSSWGLTFLFASASASISIVTICIHSAIASVNAVHQ